jgi:hypothetical protein
VVWREPPVTIYVALLDEDVDVWRPVAAEHLEGDLYRLLDETPEGEVWEFATGDVVRCRMRRFSGRPEDALVACEKST